MESYDSFDLVHQWRKAEKMAGSKSKKLFWFGLLFVAGLNDAIEFGSSKKTRSVDAFVTEATEVIAVVKIGVSLVEYIYKVFSNIFEDSGISDSDLVGENKIGFPNVEMSH